MDEAIHEIGLGTGFSGERLSEFLPWLLRRGNVNSHGGREWQLKPWSHIENWLNVHGVAWNSLRGKRHFPRVITRLGRRLLFLNA
eukprot:668672-Pyramimonas_sp.AAC.1